MFHKRSFKLLSALGVVAIVVALVISAGGTAPQTASAGKAALPKNLDRGPELWVPSASQPSRATPLDLHERHPESIAYRQSEHVAGDELKQGAPVDQQTRDAIQARWLAQHGDDNRTCVLLCGGR
jgi:hypothetical protein